MAQRKRSVQRGPKKEGETPELSGSRLYTLEVFILGGPVTAGVAVTVQRRRETARPPAA